MVHPNAILSIKPPNQVEEIIKEKKIKKINVYLDIKNACTSLFIDEVVQEIVNASDSSKLIDSSIFQAILNFASFWKKYSKYNSVECEIFFCCDKGESFFHTNIDKRYKKNREIGRINLPDYYQGLVPIRRKNMELSEYICNRIPGVYFFLTKNLESDFLPYYLITRVNNTQEDSLHLVISNDKDLYQSFTTDNVLMLYKMKGVTYFLDKDMALSHYFGISKSSQNTKEQKMQLIKNLEFDYFPMLMSFCGDMGDNVYGIDKFGPIKALKCFEGDTYKKILGKPKDILDRILSGGKMIPEDSVGLALKYPLWKEVLQNNDLVTCGFKLISFEYICRWIEKQSDLESIEHSKYLNKILNKEELFSSSKSLIKGLNFIEDMYITEEGFSNLFI